MGPFFQALTPILSLTDRKIDMGESEPKTGEKEIEIWGLQRSPLDIKW